MDARHRVRAESPAALVRPDRRVDPMLVEESPGDGAGFRRERVVGIEHQLARLAEREQRLLLEDRRRAVVVAEPIDPEQLRLQPVPALWDVEPTPYRVDQRQHRLVGGLVGEVSRCQPMRIGAQAVVDGLLVDQRVVDEGERSRARLERGRDRLGRLLPSVTVGALQFAQRELQRDLLTAQRYPERRDQLAKQPRPSRTTRQALLGKHLLLGLGQQVRPIATCTAQVVSAELEPAAREQLLDPVIIERGPFELEEQQPRLHRGQPLLHPLQQRATLRVGGVRRELKRRVRAGLTGRVLDRGELHHGRSQPRAVEGRHPSGVRLRESVGSLQRLVQQALGAVLLVAVDQRRQVPLGGEQLRVREVVAGHSRQIIAAAPGRTRRPRAARAAGEDRQTARPAR